MGKKNSKIQYLDIIYDPLNTQIPYRDFYQELNLMRIRLVLEMFCEEKDQQMMNFQQFSEVVVVACELKLYNTDQADQLKNRLKGFFKIMKIKDNNKVNIYEYVILMVLFSKYTTNSEKLKFIFNILDFDRSYNQHSDILLVIVTLFITAISRIFEIKMNKFTNTDLLYQVSTFSENFSTPQPMNQSKLKEFVFTEEGLLEFMNSLCPFDLTHGNTITAPINNKKQKVTMIADVKNMSNQQSLNRRQDAKEKDFMTIKTDDTFDDEKAWVHHLNKKVHCKDIKALYIWFYTMVNEHGTFSNKLDYMTQIRQLNTNKAKMLALIEDLVSNLEQLIENSLSEISLNDLLISLYFRKEKKNGVNFSEHIIMQWVDRFNVTIEMDKSKIQQRVEIINLRKLFWQIDKNRSGSIDFNEQQGQVSSVYSLDQAKLKFKKADKDNDADVDFIEFCKIMIKDSDSNFNQAIAEEIMTLTESKISGISLY